MGGFIYVDLVLIRGNVYGSRAVWLGIFEICVA